MNTTDNNRLIAEFMGCKPINSWDVIEHNMFSKKVDVGNYIVSNSRILLSECKWNTSWDWLMPVVEKIERMGFSFEKIYQPIDNDYQCLITKKGNILFQEFSINPINAYYYVVKEFIQWYNKNKTN